jgi:hypothetical protein
MTTAAGMTPPVASLTFPAILPVASWAQTAGIMTNDESKAAAAAAEREQLCI